MIILLLFLSTFGCLISCQPQHSDVGLNVRELIEKYGYPFENHTLVSADGYMLQMHRIPHGRYTSHRGPPVLLVPSAFASSADFVNVGEKSLGFILSDSGYDVWLANYRGTTWSRKHVRLNPDVDRKQYWDFSFQEIGEYDIPAFIDYVLQVTKEKKLFYIGHSQGAVSFFALMSERPEYNKKVRLMVGLGPPTYFTHANNIIGYVLSTYKNEIQAFANRFQFYELLPHTTLLSTLGRIFCSDASPFQNFCASVFYFATGYSQELNKSLIPVIVTNTPAGGSLRSWQHLGQLYHSDKFSKYDFGIEENMRRYSQRKPPSYDLSRITAPVALYLGDKDILIAKKDVDRAASEMKNVVVNRFVKGFNHLDVLIGIDAAKVIFKEIVELMRRF